MNCGKWWPEARGLLPKAPDASLLPAFPPGFGAEKVLKIIEESGGVVVYIENCAGMKQFVNPVHEDKPVLEAIAEKYLNTHCSCMSPNPLRMELVDKICREFQADGVVDIVWQGCHTYNVESKTLQEFLKSKNNIPFLHVETDYSQGDVEQIRTRIQAFFERMP